MIFISCVLIAILVSSGVFLILQRNLFEVILGIALLSQATNLVVITSGGWEIGTQPPVIEGTAAVVETTDGKAKVSNENPALYADPLPQALVLTAIVIGFALMSFLIVLTSRAVDETGTLDLAESRADGDGVG